MVQRKCRKCGVILTNDNCTYYRLFVSHSYICRKCNTKQCKNYQKKYKNSEHGRFMNCRSKAKHDGKSFSLTEKQYITLIRKPCFYCGQQGKVGLDRVDNTSGYHIKNVVPCCEWCNRMKRHHNVDEFIKQVKLISERF